MPKISIFSRLMALLLGWTICGLPFLSAERIEFATRGGEVIPGKLIGFYSGLVFIDYGRGRTVRVPFNELDDASRGQVEIWFKTYIDWKRDDANLVSQSDSNLTAFLANNLQVLQDGDLIDYEFNSKSEPEFYAFYFSAHWCGPCRRFTPSLRAFYNVMKQLGRDNFEVILVSSDRSNKMMQRYMDEEQMPWPALKFGQRSSRFVSKYGGNGIPCLVVTDRYGNLLAHSYSGDEYLGPSVPKEILESLLKYTSAVRQKVNETESL